MFCRLFTPNIRFLVEVQGQTGDRFRNHTHTGIHSRYLNCSSCGYRFSGNTASKEKCRSSAHGILRLVTGFEYVEYVYNASPHVKQFY